MIDPAPGQLWQFASRQSPGRYHRLLIADSRQPESWWRICEPGRPIQGIFTSPPYARQRAGRYESVDPGEYLVWWEPVQASARDALAQDGSFFVNIRPHAEAGQLHPYVYDLVLQMVRLWDWRLVDELCWRRQGFPGKFSNRFKNAHEPVFHFALQTDCKFRPENVLKQTPLAYATPYSEREEAVSMPADYKGGGGRNVRASGYEGALPHNLIEAYTGAHAPGTRYGATFPPALPEFFIQAYSDPRDVWLDPFGGSGTVIEAAERTDRLAYLVDISPEAAAVTIARLGRLGLHPQLIN